MSSRRFAVPTLAWLAVLAGCSGPPPVPTEGNQLGSMGAPVAGIDANTATTALPAATPTAAPSPAARENDARLTGRWYGVEGMYLTVTRAAEAGRYRLEMQYDLDNRQVTEARREGDTLVFERAGVRRVLRPTDGAATGLKYLADARDCLTVAEGEGYCRR